jgi:hypothetical protein
MYGIFPEKLVFQNSDHSTIDPIGRKYRGNYDFGGNGILAASTYINFQHFYFSLAFILIFVVIVIATVRLS